MTSGRTVDLAGDHYQGVIRVAYVDDHRMVLDGLGAWLKDAAHDVVVVLAVESWAALLASPLFPVDVVLLDLNLHDNIPLSVKIPAILTAGAAVVVVSSAADPVRIRGAVSAGAIGYVPKSESPQEIVAAIRHAAVGQTYISECLAIALMDGPAVDTRATKFSPQEARVLELYATGLPLKSVARRLDISTHTAKGYLDRVREKYAAAGREARSKIDLHRRAIEDGYLTAGFED